MQVQDFFFFKGQRFCGCTVGGMTSKILETCTFFLSEIPIKRPPLQYSFNSPRKEDKKWFVLFRWPAWDTSKGLDFLNMLITCLINTRRPWCISCWAPKVTSYFENLGCETYISTGCWHPGIFRENISSTVLEAFIALSLWPFFSFSDTWDGLLHDTLPTNS